MKLNENAIAQNRAEELGYDLWEDFVIPPFYDGLDLLNAKKPRVVVGGRGCGKTSLLRYLCHQTQFSTKRTAITEFDIQNIGIYWRVDTQFAKILSKRGFDEDSWNRAFEHLSVLMMCQEILKSLESIANSSMEGFESENLDSFDFSILNSFDNSVPNRFSTLKVFIRREINRFQTWAGSIRSVEPPVFYPLNFVKELISEIRNQNALFEKTCYLVYIDEYENLLVDQQRLINTWIKHSEMPLIFNLAMKPNSFTDKNTIGNEPIAETHDYREIDLEEYYEKINFELFAAEILFLRLWKNDNTFKIPIIPEELRSTNTEILGKRNSPAYRRKVLHSANEFLPGFSVEEMALGVFSDPTLNNRLVDLIKRGLKVSNSKINFEDFLLRDQPMAGVIIPALLNRDISPSEILDEITKLRGREPNKFTGTTNWLHNNVFGCLLLIYEPLGRSCPIYTGFEAFCTMAKTNLRHFLELCYKSITNEVLFSNKKSIKVVLNKAQAEASKQASLTFLREVKNFGNEGNRLHTFVLRLGTFFSYAQRRPSQSEPEQNHFSIRGTRSSTLNAFLNDAVKWSVLYEERITKQKGGEKQGESEDYEYILNPIYAPYFHISYRKKRSVQFSMEEISSIIFGDFNEFESLMKNVSKSWKLIPSDSTMNLFTDFEV
jgi:hypothetical protein